MAHQDLAGLNAQEQGMQSGGLARLVETVGGYKQDSLLIARHGKIVLDAYYAPYQPNITHDLRSVTKSIVSTLTAIEIKQGLLDSADHPVMDLFADKQIPDVDEAKKAMTVQHLLDMTSGIAWQEKSYTPDETIMRMYEAADRTAFVLSQPMSDFSGHQVLLQQRQSLCAVGAHQQKTGQNALEFAKKDLFGPLGITSERWGRPDAQGVIDGEAGLSLAPHDMARIGSSLPSQWDVGGKADRSIFIGGSGAGKARSGDVRISLRKSVVVLPEKGAYMARGRHSQLILVLPKQDIVAVMTGILRDDQFYPTIRLIDDIVSAVRVESAAANRCRRAILAHGSDPRCRHGSAVTTRQDARTGATDIWKDLSGRRQYVEDKDLRAAPRRSGPLLGNHDQRRKGGPT